jgi:MSHA biogenesis protein MshI
VFGLLTKAAVARGRIGVALMPEQLALAVIRREAAGPPLLERCETVPLGPPDQPERIAVALRAANLPALPISCVLQPGDYQLALVEAPDVPPAELRAAMRWRLKDHINFRVEDAVIDVFEVPSPQRAGQHRMVYAVAARRSLIEHTATQLSSLPGFQVLDVPELCLRNLLALLPAAPSGVGLLYLGDHTATVIIVRGTVFHFVRNVELGAAARIDPTAVALEVMRSLDYYERHFDQPPITQLAIAPAGPRSEHLLSDLGRETGLEVIVLDLNTLLPSPALVPPERQQHCLLAVGAALREERRSL